MKMISMLLEHKGGKMEIQSIYSNHQLNKMAKDLYQETRNKKRLDGWFYALEAKLDCLDSLPDDSNMIKSAFALQAIVQKIPLSISENNIFAGSQDDAFSRTYALINPAFKVESFTGYNDVVGIFSDIEPNDDITEARITSLKERYEKTQYVQELNQVNTDSIKYTKEAVFFIEQVTGHVIPDFKPLLQFGIDRFIKEASDKEIKENNVKYKDGYKAMKIALEAYIILSNRYADLAKEKANQCTGNDKKRFLLMENTLRHSIHTGAKNLYEALQLFLIAWQCMCLEQIVNPYAFSVGNADRIFEPYRALEDTDRETASALFKHFLVFYNVGDRSWAISQNLILSGKSIDGQDLTNPTTYALLDAYYDMNLPQPILSIKLHRNTPDELYKEIGRFLFTPGALTPSFFNDDELFDVLSAHGIEQNDLEDYSVAGCQEPLIMGKDNGNTTNTWLNLAKILELTLNNGYSTLTGEKIGLSYRELGYDSTNPEEILYGIREAFYKNTKIIIDLMVEQGNNASKAISNLAVPFLSTAMGGLENGIDMRDYEEQGTKYNASGCLIHGSTVVSDSFVAIDDLLKYRPEDASNLLEALRNNFEGYEELHQFLSTAPKFGNSLPEADNEAEAVVTKVANFVNESKNYLGNSFRSDFSTPSTHLLYGYWVGALPNGRKSREMLNYGLDPLYGEATNGIGLRVLSARKLPYELMPGGAATHFGLDPKYFKGDNYYQKGIEVKNKIVKPYFFGHKEDHAAPFYFYVNVTTPEILRAVLKDPQKYAPSGVYIMRIHGTFVNFLDLSPSIQDDIIRRLDLKSTVTC